VNEAWAGIYTEQAEAKLAQQRNRLSALRDATDLGSLQQASQRAEAEAIRTTAEAEAADLAARQAQAVVDQLPPTGVDGAFEVTAALDGQELAAGTRLLVDATFADPAPLAAGVAWEEADGSSSNSSSNSSSSSSSNTSAGVVVQTHVVFDPPAGVTLRVLDPVPFEGAVGTVTAVRSDGQCSATLTSGAVPEAKVTTATLGVDRGRAFRGGAISI
ncbi:MAG: hypothetical protein VXZ27_13240, partial [SAR324 cluster bacterium]|nr:hypothetical protein [SAR324 cluster bacterium]